MTPEAKVKRRITATLKDAKVWYFMPVAGRFGKAGVPDYICCIAGQFVGIEAKANGGTQTGLQKQTGREIIASGGYCLVIDETNIDKLPAWIEGCKTKTLIHV